MTNNYKYKIKGWDVKFTKNIHMYCHELIASKGSYIINIPCEDMSKESHIGIWLDNLDIPEKHLSELTEILKLWSKEMGYKSEITVNGKLV